MLTARCVTKLLGVGLFIGMLIIAVMDWPPWMIESQGARTRVLSSLFACGLFIVAAEDIVGINKSAIMLLTAATMWTCLAVGYHPTTSEVGAHKLHHELDIGLQDVGSVILFLLPAMGVVESMDHFGAFACVTVVIRKLMGSTESRLLPIMCFLTFFLSSVIDNLTATIVALKILRHMAADNEELRHLCGGLVVMAANAGGAWSAIGDVTTTMLWISGKITPAATMKWLFLPSLIAGTCPLVFMCASEANRAKRSASNGSQAHGARKQARGSKGYSDGEASPQVEAENIPLRCHTPTHHDVVTLPKVLVMIFGLLFILMVPILKMTTGLPPYLGMLLALGGLWLLTDHMKFDHVEEGNSPISPSTMHTGPPSNGVALALHKVDLTGLLFFTGVLLAVGALNSAGILKSYAVFLVRICGRSPVVLCTLLGISSAIVDNVPLVEAAIDMFDEVGVDEPLWQLVALAAGTGGSILSIGSIAGVTFMSMEGIGFLWFCRKISAWALLSFFLGIATYQLERVLLA